MDPEPSQSTPAKRKKEWPSEMQQTKTRVDMAKWEWNELVRTGRKTLETRRQLSEKWDVEYTHLCRSLRDSSSFRSYKPPLPPGGEPVDKPAGNTLGPDGEPIDKPVGSNFRPGGLFRETLANTLLLARAKFEPPPRRMGPGRPRKIVGPSGLRVFRPRPPPSVELRGSASHARSSARPGDPHALLSDSEEAAILLWFRFRLDVADLVTVPELVDAGNAVIYISGGGDLEGFEAGVAISPPPMRSAFTRWAQEFMLHRTDLFWSTVKPRAFDAKERPEPDPHSFINWFYGPHGPEDKKLVPKKSPTPEPSASSPQGLQS